MERKLTEDISVVVEELLQDSALRREHYQTGIEFLTSGDPDDAKAAEIIFRRHLGLSDAEYREIVADVNRRLAPA